MLVNKQEGVHPLQERASGLGLSAVHEVQMYLPGGRVLLSFLVGRVGQQSFQLWRKKLSVNLVDLKSEF